MKKQQRVVVVGARRKRQGTGPFVASSFVKAGAQVCGIVGTSQGTVDIALRELRESFCIKCQGYVSLDRALACEKPDILAICSPFEVHLNALETAADVGIHCLCEKPLWWDSSPQKLVKTTKILHRFQEKNRLLQTITQWPYTLPYFFKIYPEETFNAVVRFEMELSPREHRQVIIPDSVPHLFSMLYALAGYGKVKNADAQLLNREKKHWKISFLYTTQKTDVETVLHLIPVETPPRPAAYAVNGKKIRRRIILPDYTFTFDAKGQSLFIEDPLELLIGDFLEKVYSRTQLDFQNLYCGMESMETLVSSVEPHMNSLREPPSTKIHD